MALSTKLIVRNSQFKLGVSIVEPHTNVSYVIPAAHISYIKLSLVASLDTENRNPYVSDFAIVLDQAAIGVGKNFSDYVSFSDSLSYFDIGKGLDEQITPVESFDISVGFIRELAETANPIDVFGMNFSTTFSESISVIDNLSIGTALLKDDVGVIQDDADITNGPDWAFGKSTVDLIGASDEPASSVGKVLADVFSVSESSLLSTGKVLADLFSVSDAISNFDTGKSLDDNASQTDAISSFDTGKALVDTQSITESPAFDTGKTLADTYAGSDSAVLAVGKALADTFTGADSISAFNIGPVYADSVSAAEAAVLYYQTTYSDTFNVSDGTISSTNKALSDNISGIADSGSLYMTDYCDITYFAEAYVGTYQTF